MRESETVVSPYLLVICCLFVSLVRLVLLVAQAGATTVLGWTADRQKVRCHSLNRLNASMNKNKLKKSFVNTYRLSLNLRPLHF